MVDDLTIRQIVELVVNGQIRLPSFQYLTHDNPPPILKHKKTPDTGTFLSVSTNRGTFHKRMAFFI